MLSPITVVVVLTLSMINLSESSLEVHLDANNHLPTHIGEDIALSLKCSFFSNDTHDDFQSIYEISICEVDQDKETKLATLNALVDDILLFMDNASTKVEGKAYTTNGYLKIDTTEDEASSQNFSCLVKYLDKTLGFKTLTASASIKGNNIFILFNERFTAQEERFSKLERNLTGLWARLSAVEVQMSNVNNKLSNIDTTLTKLDSTLSRILNVTEENRKKIEISESNFNHSVSLLQNLTEENHKRMDSAVGRLLNLTEDNRKKIDGTVSRFLNLTEDNRKKIEKSESNFNRSVSLLQNLTEVNHKRIDSAVSRFLNLTEDNRKKINRSESDLKYALSSLRNLTVEHQSNITISISSLQSSVEENQRKIEQKLNHTIFANRCTEVTRLGATTWPRQIIKTSNGTSYLCDIATDNGGWTVFQRRFNGQQDFYQNWTTYEQGFGDINNDFWLGLMEIRNLVKDEPHELRVDLMYKGKPYYAHYKSFEILDASTNYRLLVSGYSGNAGDALANHNNVSFSTFDRDNDLWTGNCATDFSGAWWYIGCHNSHLNGLWGTHSYKGLVWLPTIDGDSATFTEMKMRPRNN